jgi:hypothetical protein
VDKLSVFSPTSHCGRVVEDAEVRSDVENITARTAKSIVALAYDLSVFLWAHISLGRGSAFPQEFLRRWETEQFVDRLF